MSSKLTPGSIAAACRFGGPIPKGVTFAKRAVGEKKESKDRPADSDETGKVTVWRNPTPAGLPCTSQAVLAEPVGHGRRIRLHLK